jgi:hypothetical protein
VLITIGILVLIFGAYLDLSAYAIMTEPPQPSLPLWWWMFLIAVNAGGIMLLYIGNKGRKVRIAFLVFGIMVFLLGVWFDFGVFLSGGSGTVMPISWISFIIPGAITATGITLMILGIKLRARTEPVKDNFQSSLGKFHSFLS